MRCSACRKNKRKNQFEKHRKICRSCKCERLNEKRRIKSITIKKKCLDYKGYNCSKCNYGKYTGALDFHHVDPKKKLFSISNAYKLGFSWRKIKKELDKCILVCKNCHAEIHQNII